MFLSEVFLWFHLKLNCYFSQKDLDILGSLVETGSIIAGFVTREPKWGSR